MADDPWSIGKRRWQVSIGRRTETPSTTDTGTDEHYEGVHRVWANIVPTGAATYYGSVQVDTPVTHRVWLRWTPWQDAWCVILRDTKLPDGTYRREVFRVRRALEDDGRKRFVMLEVELEHRSP